MKYIVIGLGNYGSVLAEELSLLGHEVIGVDRDEGKVELIKEKVATSFILDATDEQALEILPLRDVDIVIVAIGENLGASIRVVALLKKNNVAHIYARAVDELHRTVLEAFSLDSILAPEQDAARSLAQQLDLKVHVSSFQVDKEHYIVKFKTPRSLIGVKISELALKSQFNLTVIALVRGRKTLNCLGVSIFEHNVDNSFGEDGKLEEEDQLVCYATYKDLVAFWKAV